jgi:HSP20 family molecular chaperone IbpA
MASLERWNPSRELGFAVISTHYLTVLALTGGIESPGVRLLSRSSRAARSSIVLNLPGIAPKNVDITVVRNMLTTKGLRDDRDATTKRHFFKHDIHYDSFERSISFLEGIKAEDLMANYHDGILVSSVLIPKEALTTDVKIHIEGPTAKRPKKAQSRDAYHIKGRLTQLSHAMVHRRQL